VNAPGKIVDVGDVARFKSAAHFASYNGTAPIEASSGERRRHRLNPRGNRQLNYAIHVAAITQLRYPCNGRHYYDRKRAEGKNAKEAIRALKRQISNVFRLRNTRGQQMKDTPFPVPPQRGIFTRLSPAQFRALARKAQGYTDAQSAHQVNVRTKTISSYVVTCRERLGIISTQDLVWAFYSEYAPDLLNPPDVEAE